jgi:hypothetical protein
MHKYYFYTFTGFKLTKSKINQIPAIFPICKAWLFAKNLAISCETWLKSQQKIEKPAKSDKSYQILANTHHTFRTVP